MISLPVSMAVPSADPLIAFGFLLLPALTSHRLAWIMRHFTITASLLGGIDSFVSFWLAYDRNLSVGPTDVVLGLINFLSFLAKKLWLAPPFVLAAARAANADKPLAPGSKHPI